MSLMDFIFKTRRLQIDKISVDATMRETHTHRSVCTDNPIEGGASVTDHVNVKPAELEIEGIITDTPVTFSVIDSATGLVNTVKGFTGGKSRAVEYFEKFLDLRASRVPFNVITGLKVYKNMILEDFTVNRDANTANAIVFTAKMKEIVYAYAKTTGGTSGLSAGNAAEEVEDLASKTADKGGMSIEKFSDIAGNVGGALTQVLTLFAPLL